MRDSIQLHQILTCNAKLKKHRDKFLPSEQHYACEIFALYAPVALRELCHDSENKIMPQ